MIFISCVSFGLYYFDFCSSFVPLLIGCTSVNVLAFFVNTVYCDVYILSLYVCFCLHDARIIYDNYCFVRVITTVLHIGLA